MNATPVADVVAAVSEDHRLDVDRGSPFVGNVVELAVRLRALVVPGAEDGADRAPELLARIVGKVVAGALADDRLVAAHDLGEVGGGQVLVALRAAGLLDLLHRLLELVARHAEHDVAVHLDEPPPAVVREALARERGEAGDRPRREPQVQDRVHHARHGRARAGADRDEERIRRVAEPLVGGVLEPAERGLDLRADSVEARAARHVGADRRLDREARRHRDAEGRHLGEARALAAECFLAEAGALGGAVSE